MIDRVPQQAGIALRQRVEAALEHLEQLTVLMLHAQNLGAQHRRQRECDEARDHHRAGDRDAELAQEPARGACQERERAEHRDQRDRGRDDRECDFVRAVRRRLFGRLVQLFLVPEGVLEHDDGVVHHDADRDRQREQRKVVDRETEEVHDRKGRDDGRRNREPGNDRGPDVPQEDEDDQHDQDRRDEQREARVVDRVRHEHRSVERALELDTERQRLLDRGQLRANAPRHVDQIGLRLPDDADRDRGRPFPAEDRAIVLGTQLHAGDVLELDELSALARHDHFAEFGGRLELAERAHRELAPGRFDPAGGDLDVARVDRGLHVLHRERARRQGVGLHPHAHRVAPLAEDGGAADARQALQPRFHQPVGHIGELHQVVVVAREREPEERLRIGRLLRDHRLEHVHRQAASHA